MSPKDLRAWMEANGYSVRVLAGKLGVTPVTVQNWRHGATKIPPYLGRALSTLE
ncbi:MAG: helix-turn-helix domain-containing protein [Gammaproteobacteria bacterium]|nr:helix-turn-helix domain-containing protein [Gammaproteobacteria bacterium]